MRMNPPTNDSVAHPRNKVRGATVHQRREGCAAMGHARAHSKCTCPLEHESLECNSRLGRATHTRCRKIDDKARLCDRYIMSLSVVSRECMLPDALRTWGREWLLRLEAITFADGDFVSLGKLRFGPDCSRRHW
jgi:hypothetical protein